MQNSSFQQMSKPIENKCAKNTHLHWSKKKKWITAIKVMEMYIAGKNEFSFKTNDNKRGRDFKKGHAKHADMKSCSVNIGNSVES